MADPTKSAEQQARDMMERMGVPDAQSYSAGDLVELANLIANAYRCRPMPDQGFRSLCAELLEALLDEAHPDDTNAPSEELTGRLYPLVERARTALSQPAGSWE